MSDYSIFGPPEWDEFLRDLAVFSVRLENQQQEYVIPMPRDDLKCVVRPGFDPVANERISRCGTVSLERVSDGEPLYIEQFEIYKSSWETQFREHIIKAMRDWRDLVL